MLMSDAKRYCEELFEARRALLLKEREKAREAVRRNLSNFEDAEKLAGYPGILQPDIDYGVALSYARKDALLKAYEFDGQRLNERIANGIVADAVDLLQQSLGGVMASEKGRMELLALRTRRSDTAASAKLGSLSRHIGRTMSDAQRAMRNELNLQVLREKKSALRRSPTMTVSELRAKVESFRSELNQHFQLWLRSLDQPLPDRPIRNIDVLEQQRSSLARQLGALRPYIDKLGLPTVMGTAYGPSWDAYSSAVSNDIAIRKGSSLEAILPQLEEAIGRLDALNPNSEFELEHGIQPRNPQHVTIHQHGPQSRVNLNSKDQSVNVLSITEQKVFSDIRDALQQRVSDDGQLDDILAKLADLESAIHQPTSLENFQAFINSAASYMTIIGPFVPALVQMLHH